MENPKNSQPKSGNHTSVPPVPFVPRFPATATSPLEGEIERGLMCELVYCLYPWGLVAKKQENRCFFLLNCADLINFVSK